MGETRVSVNLKESFGWFNKPYYEVLGAAQLTYTGLKILESMDIGIWNPTDLPTDNLYVSWSRVSQAITFQNQLWVRTRDWKYFWLGPITGHEDTVGGRQIQHISALKKVDWYHNPIKDFPSLREAFWIFPTSWGGGSKIEKLQLF